MAAVLLWFGWVSALDVVVVAALALLCGLIFVTQRVRIPKGLRLPPGPPSTSILGNASDMPNTYDDWIKYSQWADKYGDLICLKSLGKHVMIVNSADVAHDLFEKASSNYSDRSDMPMVNDLVGFDWGMGFMKYGEKWRRHRRMFNKGFHRAATSKYWDLQMRQTRKMLKSISESPEDFVEHLLHAAGAVITEAVYGFEVLPKNDPYLDMASKAIGSITVAASPGKYLVDTVPILKYVPEWVPGAGFRKQARIWREEVMEYRVAPFYEVKKHIAAGTAKPSITASLLEEASRKDDTPVDQEDVICNTVAVSHLAGASASAVVLHIFFLAMILHPEAQQRAQAELHNVIGDQRLPTFQDREKLPYINAMCKEILRWKPSTPFGMPHTNSQDGVYRGYFIPKGSIMFGNAARMLHDEATYGPEPENFRPERFLVPGVKDPNVAFGFGRRICPGRYFFENLLFISVACILQVFDIKRAKDMSGREIPVEKRFIEGLIAHPEPFQCAIIPRSEQARRLIYAADDE